MNGFIDVSDRPFIHHCLARLELDAVPLWGYMTALQLLEHLVVSVEYTNGKKQTICRLSPEEAAKGKQFIIYTDAPIPMGIKTPGRKANPDAARFTSLAAAIISLQEELDAFEQYFETPGATSIHPGFGELNYKEWLVFHSKHFTHHFKQFGLLDQ